MPPVLFAPGVDGTPADVTDYNANWSLVEGSLDDIGEYIISGLVQSAGTGLSVNVTSGVASIGGRVTKSTSFTIGGLTPSTTNHLYLNQNGTGTANTSGTQPALSVKLGTATTDGSGVTVVGVTWAAGRMTRRRTESLIHGSGAGHPRAVDLASWHATNNEGNEVKGTLPAGAMPGSFNAPLTLTLDDANQNSVQVALSISHTYNAGGGGAGIGVEQDFVVETSANGTTKVAANLQATLTDLTPATATGKLAVRVIANNVQVTPLTVATADIRIPQATVATSQHGLLNIGSGGFDGSGGHFAGDAPGTQLAINAPSGYTGTYVDIQKNGVRLFYLDQFGTLFRLSAPVGTANDGQLSLGDAFTAFDGATSGKFVGSASGTYLAINAGSGFAGSLIDAQLQGAARFKVSNSGAVTATDALSATLADAGTSTEPTMLTLAHRSTGTPVASFGTTVLLQADNGSNALTNQLKVASGWSSATAGAESSLVIFSVRRSGADTEVLRFNANGAGRAQFAGDLFHVGSANSVGFFNVGPVTRQVGASAAGIAAIADASAKAAITALQNALAAYGLVTAPA
jgi:hypothetical protein